MWLVSEGASLDDKKKIVKIKVITPLIQGSFHRQRYCRKDIDHQEDNQQQVR